MFFNPISMIPKAYILQSIGSKADDTKKMCHYLGFDISHRVYIKPVNTLQSTMYQGMDQMRMLMARPDLDITTRRHIIEYHQKMEALLTEEVSFHKENKVVPQTQVSTRAYQLTNPQTGNPTVDGYANVSPEQLYQPTSEPLKSGIKIRNRHGLTSDKVVKQLGKQLKVVVHDLSSNEWTDPVGIEGGGLKERLAESSRRYREYKSIVLTSETSEEESSTNQEPFETQMKERLDSG